MSVISEESPRSLSDFRRLYREARVSPKELLHELRTTAATDSHNCWIHLLSETELDQQLDRLEKQDPDLPLYGIPFAIKDNLDLAGVPTTAGCPDYAYTPAESAFVVQRLIDLGAVPLGKTNLDQFATGLNGTRSPYGACQNALNPHYISGGSSSGSAVSVALGYVAFSLGTDTAGSGRVPAMFNKLYGVKPTRGLLSNRGMVPACASLDCVSIFAHNASDSALLLDLAAIEDRSDPWSRANPFANQLIAVTGSAAAFRFGVPRAGQLEFFGDSLAAEMFSKSLRKLEAIGGVAVELDFSCLFEAARLLYQGPWVAERYLAIRELIENRPQVIDPVVRKIVEPARDFDALQTFDAQYRLQTCRKASELLLDSVDLLVTPTAPTAYSIEAMLADPVQLNSNLGYYTNFMNLLDLSALAIPTGELADGVGFGITLFHRAFRDQWLLSVAARLEAGSSQEDDHTISPVPGKTLLAVCGAHLEGQPLNWQLTKRAAKKIITTQTAKGYRLYDLNEKAVRRPALVRDPEIDSCVEVEIWEVPTAEMGSFLAGIAPPLALGQVQLSNGQWVQSFVCEENGIKLCANATEISKFGGWRAYLDQRPRSG